MILYQCKPWRHLHGPGCQASQKAWLNRSEPDDKSPDVGSDASQEAPAATLHSVCRPGDRSLLLGELGRVFPSSTHRALDENWIESELFGEDAEGTPSLALAQQCVPDAIRIRQPSIAKLAQSISPRLVDALAEHDGPWRLHAYCVEHPEGELRRVRCERVAERVLDFLHKKQRRLERTQVKKHADTFEPDEALVQLALVQPDLALLAVTLPGERHRLRRCLSRWPGGLAPVDDDRAPPSRAYRKLIEAEAHLGKAIDIGDRVVDLGAAPGGWSHVALSRGAMVTAVDRSPLDEIVMAHDSLDFHQGDGFAYEPEYPPVDWLLCDLIAYPERTVELVQRWADRGLCRNFVVTVKFQGEDEYPRLEQLKAILEGTRFEFELRRLFYNRNEITALGTT